MFGKSSAHIDTDLFTIYTLILSTIWHHFMIIIAVCNKTADKTVALCTMYYADLAKPKSEASVLILIINALNF